MILDCLKSCKINIKIESYQLFISRFAYDHNCLMLRGSCLNYIWENFVSVSQEEEFGDLPKEMICSEDMLGSEMLKVDSEYQVLNVIVIIIDIDK